MLREGRFEKSVDPEAAEYTSSLKEDIRLLDAVILINKAHVQMLKNQEIIKTSESDQILKSLSDLQKEKLENLDLRPELEDIHMVVEEYVKEKIGGDIGGKLHTAKSRNDQVSAAIRMVLREEILEIQELITELAEEIIQLAEKNTETIMPGYTHLQVAETTTFAHYLSNYVQALTRDVERLNESYKQTNKSPLGACAFGGTSFPIDRESVSKSLGFEEVLENTMDAVGSRDFALQAMSDLGILMTNLSRLAEEIVLWSSTEFNMVEIPEEFVSTSSIMPQKKNPEVAELSRAKTSRIIGNLISGINIMKNLPQAYNLDLQELTTLLWDSVDETKSSLKVMKKMVGKIEPKKENMRKNAAEGYATLTELANTLVRENNLPFRKAHSVVGQLASQSMKDNKGLEDLEIEDLQSASEEILGEKLDISKKQFEESLNLEKCVEKRDIKGGPSQKVMEKDLPKFKNKIEKYESTIDKQKNTLREKLQKISKGD